MGIKRWKGEFYVRDICCMFDIVWVPRKIIREVSDITSDEVIKSMNPLWDLSLARVVSRWYEVTSRQHSKLFDEKAKYPWWDSESGMMSEIERQVCDWLLLIWFAENFAVLEWLENWYLGLAPPKWKEDSGAQNCMRLSLSQTWLSNDCLFSRCMCEAL